MGNRSIPSFFPFKPLSRFLKLFLLSRNKTQILKKSKARTRRDLHLLRRGGSLRHGGRTWLRRAGVLKLHRFQKKKLDLDILFCIDDESGLSFSNKTTHKPRSKFEVSKFYLFLPLLSGSALFTAWLVFVRSSFFLLFLFKSESQKWLRFGFELLLLLLEVKKIASCCCVWIGLGICYVFGVGNREGLRGNELLENIFVHSVLEGFVYFLCLILWTWVFLWN